MASSIKKNNKIGSIYRDGIEYCNNVIYKSGSPNELVKEFLNKLIEQFTVEASRRMYITEHALTLICKEQMTTIMTQSLSTITNTFLVKPQFEGRHESIARMAYSGLDAEVDFWIIYEGIIILLSFNNETTSITSSRAGKKMVANWNTLYDGLDKVKYTGKLNDSNDYPIYKVALDIIAFTKKVHSIDEYMGDYNLSTWRNRFNCVFDPKPNWTSCWKLNSELAGPYEYIDIIEAYPAVVFLANMKPIHDESKVYKGERLDALATVTNKKTRNRIAGDWVYWAYQKVSIEKPNILTN